MEEKKPAWEEDSGPATPPIAVIADRLWTVYGALEGSEALGATVVRAQLAGQILVRSSSQRRLFLQDASFHLAREDLKATAERVGGSATGVDIRNIAKLPAFLATEAAHVLHDPGLGLMAALLHLRTESAHQVFPVSACHHAICYSEQLHSLFLPLLLAPALPCDVIVSPSHAAQSALRRLLDQVGAELQAPTGRRHGFKGGFEVIPYGVETSIFRPVDKAEARRMLALPEGAVIILYHGRLDPYTKADLRPLLLAFAQLVREPHDQPLLLVISGQDVNGASARLEKMALEMGLGSSVRFLTNTAFELLPSVYSTADVFVSPSDNLQEAFGISLIEAMACGLPVIAPNWNGYRDTVRHGETGMLVDTLWARCDDSINAMAPLGHWALVLHHLAQSVALDWGGLLESLRALLRNPGLRLAMGEAGRRRAVAHYDWAVIVAQYQKVWGQQLADARSLSVPRRSMIRHIQPRYFEAFSGYPSRLLRPHSGLRRSTDASHQEVSTATGPYQASEGLLDSRVLTHALALLTHHERRTGKPLSVGALSNSLGATYALAGDGPMLHIMWLLKYGYAIAEPDQDSAEPA